MRVILALSFILFVLLMMVFPSFRPWSAGSSSDEIAFLRFKVKELKQELSDAKHYSSKKCNDLSSSLEVEEKIAALQEEVKRLTEMQEKEPPARVGDTSSEKECPPALMIANSLSGDRAPGGTYVDLTYKFRYDHEVHQLHTDHSADSVMRALHNRSVYDDPQLPALVEMVGANIHNEVGSHLLGLHDIIPKTFRENKPKIFLEIGCFRGGGSLRIARLIEELSDDVPELKDAFVISIDTWLLDLDFAWRQDTIFKQSDPTYFGANPRVAGMQTMYLTFLDNVMRNNMTHRIVPVPSTSLNAALALVAHQIRPQFIYLDASHANPDVFLDLVTYWELLEGGRWIVLDDYPIRPVKAACTAFIEQWAHEIERSEENNRQMWILKKK